MRDADAEQEPAARLLGKGALTISHGHRVARVDVGDPGRYDQPLGVGEQPGRMYERVSTAALGDPQRAISPFFDPLGESRRLRRTDAVHPDPNAELAEFHFRSSFTRAAASVKRHTGRVQSARGIPLCPGGKDGAYRKNCSEAAPD